MSIDLKRTESQKVHLVLENVVKTTTKDFDSYLAIIDIEIAFDSAKGNKIFETLKKLRQSTIIEE